MALTSSKTLLLRLRTTLLVALPVYLFFLPMWLDRWAALLLRIGLPSLAGLAAFCIAERWPRRLPQWLARWAWQVGAVAVAIPLTVLLFYQLAFPAEAGPFWQDPKRLEAVFAFCFLGTLIGPWAAMSALLRQRDIAMRQAEQRRGELERQVLGAQLQLLQAQVQPHFLFNTLANVQALVEDGSPQAGPVLSQLIAYLRAAVPRLHESQTRLGQELDMVRAYLALMRLRMPDRLSFNIEVAPDCDTLLCPPLTLMTLVENAIRHGIDPSLDGGHIELQVRRQGERCLARVSDSGVGLQAHSTGLGTGLSRLRERLEALFGPDIALRISELQPKGFAVELEWPARRE
ncbi:sensor histidine kinase [Paucibacter sp. KBW04]|uniref:sensor histidine kinase n=1 Tax=Paucibacter sp. KBW04 TaxID=2153361 RepID=UPI000F582241|nr:histidine kinase [Paucibacter sp. KBW04]RQO61899.1 sensor histidine kinase [Paucibacter sp. KBW04]